MIIASIFYEYFWAILAYLIAGGYWAIKYERIQLTTFSGIFFRRAHKLKLNLTDLIVATVCSYFTVKMMLGGLFIEVLARGYLDYLIILVFIVSGYILLVLEPLWGLGESLKRNFSD